MRGAHLMYEEYEWTDTPSLTAITNTARQRRSTLYSLPPIGIGTPFVESLTSYIGRLATAHSLYVGALVSHVMLPLFGRPYLRAKPRAEGTFWRKSVAFNGIGEWAEDAARVLGSLTMRSDLRYLTMLSYKEVLSPRGLLRRERAWCPHCLQEWATNDIENKRNKHDQFSKVFEPLLWTLEVVKTCPRHNTRLQTKCPNAGCKQSMAVLAPRTSPGYCSRCEGWLGFGSEVDVNEEGSDTTENEYQYRVWLGVRELFQAMPSWSTPVPKNNIEHTLTYYLDAMVGGSPVELARRTGLSKRSVRSMLEGAQIPQLSTVLSMSDHLETTPLHFLTATFDKKSAAIQRKPISAKRKKKRRSPRPFDREGLELTLRQVLSTEDYPPPSMREVGRLLSYDPSHLHKHFPHLCGEISAKYIAYLKAQSKERRTALRREVKHIAYKLQSYGHRPTYRLTKLHLSKPRTMCEPHAINAWHEALRELKLET